LNSFIAATDGDLKRVRFLLDRGGKGKVKMVWHTPANFSAVWIPQKHTFSPNEVLVPGL
jgi:hypothetical protein